MEAQLRFMHSEILFNIIKNYVLHAQYFTTFKIFYNIRVVTFLTNCGAYYVKSKHV